MSLPRLDHDPREERRRRGCPLVEWVATLGCWCVYDAEIITAILKSRAFIAADFAELHRGYERKIGIDCSALIRILHYIAIANEGERHAEIRRDVARVITGDPAAIKGAIAATLHQLISERCRPGASVDLVAEIVRPVAGALFEQLLGAQAVGQSEEGLSTSQIFDVYLGLNRRREINAKACAMIDGFSAANGKLKTSPEYAAALSMLGYDSIVASLSCALLAVLREAGEKRLCDIQFPRAFPATGIPYIERFADEDTVVAGVTIRKGERVRLYLDSGMPGESAENRPYFGRGRHSCLGEELSTWLWQRFAEAFSALPFRCTVERVVRRKPDWVFVYYSSIEARFHG